MRFRLLYYWTFFPKDIISHILSFVNNFCREFTNNEICYRSIQTLRRGKKEKIFSHFSIFLLNIKAICATIKMYGFAIKTAFGGAEK